MAYRYTGDRTAIELPPENEGGESRTIDLVPGNAYELPLIPYVTRGIAKGYFTPIESPSKSRKKEGSE